MRIAWFIIPAFVVLVLSGCNDRAKELEQEIAKVRGESSTLQQDIAAREKYLEEVMQAVNQVYKDIEHAKSKEAKLVEKAQGTEGGTMFTSEQMRKAVLDQISAIGSNLKDNRMKIVDLQRKLKASVTKYASLDELVQNLKLTIEQREQSIALLQAKVLGLEGTVAEKTRLVQEKEAIIDEQVNRINTVYFVVGTRDELKKKGIIADEGGFLWGLLGSTTVMASGVNKSLFTPIDRTKYESIHLSGVVDEIVPKRNEEFYALAQSKDATTADLTIKSPDKFWQDRYLVVVVD